MMFRKSSNSNPYRKSRGEVEYVYEDEKKYYGSECPVCGKPLSANRPVCFACPIYPAHYYEKKQKDEQDKRI